MVVIYLLDFDLEFFFFELVIEPHRSKEQRQILRSSWCCRLFSSSRSRRIIIGGFELGIRACSCVAWSFQRMHFTFTTYVSIRCASRRSVCCPHTVRLQGRSYTHPCPSPASHCLHRVVLQLSVGCWRGGTTPIITGVPFAYTHRTLHVLTVCDKEVLPRSVKSNV